MITSLHAEYSDARDVFDGPLDTDGGLPGFWQEVDAVIAVPRHADGSPDESTLVDIGIALGKGIPLLVLGSDDDALHGLPSLKIAKAGLKNLDALRFHVTLFLESVRKGNWFRKSLPKGALAHLDVAPAQRALEEVRRIHTGPRQGNAYEEWAVDIFQKMGATVASTPRTSDRGFDLVLFLPGMERGPLLVEVKGSTDLSALNRSALRLQGVVLDEQAGLGLVLFDDETSDVPQKSSASLPMVVVLGMTEFLNALAKEKSALRVLSRARNEAVHQL